jgi:Rps23 Pro-64 3,4-dihydroxylase Tpa1-like proline 4-hydroxylase
MIDYDLLESIDPAAYATAKPFPHVVLYDLIDALTLQAAAAEFADPSAMESQFSNQRERKSAESRWEHFGPITTSILAELNSDRFVAELTRIAAIPNLVSDNTLLGGGQHQIMQGGLLAIHADFNVHQDLGHRRMNVLAYLNEDWPEVWGGHLELWDDDGLHTAVLPTLGTVVIFSTSSSAMHGHPHPLACPPDRSRKSLATYYYSTEAADPGEAPRSTLFRY